MLEWLSTFHGKPSGSTKASRGLHGAPGSFTISVMKRLGISEMKEDELLMF